MRTIRQFIFGTVIGSFLAVVCVRLPRNESLLYPPSHCDFCGHQLRPIEMIPLISALRQKFHCSYCQQKFSPRSFGLEFFCGILCLIFLQDFQWLKLWQLFWLLSSLILAVIDWDHLIVEQTIFWSTGSLLLLSGCWLVPIHWQHPLIIFSLFYLSQKILPNSLGLGDLWMIGLWSLFLTGYELLQLLFLASVNGLLFFGYQKFRKKNLERLPFLPFLFIGLLIVLLKNF
ncbi:prepilin peptidase [Enterococcus xiangfangensis]|uniref:prepilin peptidase n=1 Tax=Enterococcus xiangfangensis TaxID=1296537 RepID=UPI00142DDB18|nr:A24 family peptidase [Enterococcus xiangfangensis]MBM7712250.1 prepilin signal peptidase PulO-like enzyme (type II secretory pathway) [Enterococcus xiangfangensis]